MIQTKAAGWKRATVFGSTLLLGAILGLGAPQNVSANETKSEKTPYFWQRDPQAGFDDEGTYHCAPVSISGGLIYLATARGFDELVDGTDHDSQIELITELATAMGTDTNDGTGPDQILSGIIHYVEGRGYSLEQLELASWRSVSAENKEYVIAQKPDADWMIDAANDPDTIVIFNFGWYKEGEDGRYKRYSGHWVNVTGAGPGDMEFTVHNPALEPELQEANTSIELELLGDDFIYTYGDDKEFPMGGYYMAVGPGVGLDENSQYVGVIDAVIAFKLNKE